MVGFCLAGFFVSLLVTATAVNTATHVLAAYFNALVITLSGVFAGTWPQVVAQIVSKMCVAPFHMYILSATYPTSIHPLQACQATTLNWPLVGTQFECFQFSIV